MVQYYSEFQDSEFKLNRIETKLLGHSFQFFTSPGVFSKNKVDKGTSLLINGCIIKKKWKILDLGCGYGAVGIAIANFFSDSHVAMVDINRRAVKLAKMNIESNKVENAKVFFSDVYSKLKEKFDTIIVNPPQRAGKELCFKIIEESKNYLNKGGLLQLVARHNKGGKTLEKKMEEVFGNVKDIAKKGGYRVYVSELK